MYLVSPDYLSKNERTSPSVTVQQKSPVPSTKHKPRARVKRKKNKKKGSPHPYDKWLNTRSEIAEAAVERKALIKAIADFMKVVLPDPTRAPKVTIPKSVSTELGTQTVRDLRTPILTRTLHFPSTSSAGEAVYETETSPISAISASYAGPPAAAAASDDDDRDTSAVSEGDVRAYARTSFGAIASPYISPFVHRRGIIDAEYGLRKEGDKFFIGNSDVTVDTNSDLYIKGKHFKGTRGLWELLTRKRINNKLVSGDDLKQYKSILNLTSAHLEGYEPHAPIHVSRGTKFKDVIAKLFPQTRRRGIEVSLRKEWEKY
jgi:hypothetical protein